MKSKSKPLCTPRLLGTRNVSLNILLNILLNCNMKCEKINELSFHTSFFYEKNQ